MPTLFGRNYQLQELEAQWGPMYEAVLAILGPAGTILPIGDPYHGQPNATTFTTVGSEQVTFTWSEAPASFATALDLTNPDTFQGTIPIVTFNGSDEEADTPDAAYWTRGDGSNDSPLSIGAWIYVTDTSNNRQIMCKYTSPQREWIYKISGTDKLSLALMDESAGAEPSRASDSAITMGNWLFAVATYDGAGGASAMDTAVLYTDGTVEASTAANNGSYVAMEDKTATVDLGHTSAAQFFDGKMAGGPMGPFFVPKELTPDEVKRLYEIGRRGLVL